MTDDGLWDRPPGPVRFQGPDQDAGHCRTVGQYTPAPRGKPTWGRNELPLRRFTDLLEYDLEAQLSVTLVPASDHISAYGETREEALE